MSLGSIAHMQYYFARTGLLDGKGAQFAKKAPILSKQVGLEREPKTADTDLVTDIGWSKENLDHPRLQLSDAADNEEDNSMLPPTVSTYREKPISSQPLPDIGALRRDLKQSLQSARLVLEEATNPTSAHHSEALPNDSTGAKTQGWYEIQGLHLLDLVTLAIRSAKDYYSFHTHPQALYSIRSERQIRTDLHQALEIMKRMASRNFRDGVREDECMGLLQWIDGIVDLLHKEDELEAAQSRRRSQWQWLQGDWKDRKHDREHLFLSSFCPDQVTIPQWTRQEGQEPTDFLRAMSSGLLLIQLHNELVSQSSRRFGSIKTFYTDLNKPYRCADNLRYWTKAAELRWQIRLDIDVLDIVYNRGEDTWNKFNEAIFTWSQTVRRELSVEWLQSPMSASNRKEEILNDTWRELHHTTD